MAEPNAEPKLKTRKSRVWMRVLAWLFALLLVLLVAVYFVFTSPTFLKNRILPRVSEALNANVTVGSSVVHPFTEIILQDIQVQSPNQPPLVTAREARVRYNLLDILGGNIRINELTLTSPVFQIVENADGTSNLDPLRQARRAQQKPVQPGKPSRPPKLDIRKITVSNATLLKIQRHSVGTRDLLELTNIDVSITGVKNGGAGRLQFAAIIREENNPPAPAMYGLLQAKLDGTFNFALTPDLRPATILGDAHLNVAQAGGSFGDFTKLAGTLHCDITPTEIKTVILSFEKDGLRMGELHAAGPFNPQKSEGNLRVELLAVDKQVLNLFAAKNGFDFGSTTITSTNHIELTKSGAAITAVGQLDASKLQLSRTNETTPPLELSADYNVSFDNIEKTALIRALNVTGTHQGRPLLQAELTSPMTLAWGKATNAVGDSSFHFAITKLNIADWKSFAGNLASAGTLDLNLKLLSQQGGKRLTFDATNQIENLTAQIGDQRITDATVGLRLRGTATNFATFSLSDYALQVLQSNQPALTVSGSGNYDQAHTNADFQVLGRSTLPRVLQLLGRSDIIASSGLVRLNAHITQTQDVQNITGDLSLTNFSGKFANNVFTNFGTVMALDASKTPQQIEIHKAAGKLNEGHNPGGNFNLSGTYSLANKPSQLTVQFFDVNQNGLRPFLAPLLANKKLVTVALNGTASAQRSPNGDSSVKADIQFTNLVVSDPEQQMPSTPLEAKVQLDASLAKQIADLHQLQVMLLPTARAKNQFQLQGRVDMSHTNVIQGSIKLSADSLDLTSYYDLFTATNRNAKTNTRTRQQNNATATAPQPSETAVTNELPFKNFTVDANVREFYLREITATNFQATVKLDSNRVLLKPFQFTLNGSLVKAGADVDVGVPGYKYAVTFNTTNVSFGPLWNTFEPERKGEVGGTLTAMVEVSGTGTSGESLQKTLAGKFDIGTTNLNLSPGKIHNPILRLLVASVAKLPELVDNALGTAASIVEGSFKEPLTGGLANDVSQSPIDVITVRGVVENGRVTLQKAVVRSTVFQADVTNGIVTLAPVLTNSAIDIPVGLSLHSSLASRLPTLILSETPTNAGYIRLPDFFSETGTIGVPKPKINVVTLAKSIVQKVIPDLTSTNSVTGDILHGVGNLLKGGSNTNRPATNQPPINPPSTNPPTMEPYMDRSGKIY